MGLSRNVVTVSLVGLLVVGSLAGCLGNKKKSSTGPEDDIVQFVEFTAAKTLADQLAALPDVESERLWLEVDVAIHLVFVGWDTAQVDEKELLSHLPKEYQPTDRIRSSYFNGNPNLGDEDRFHQEGLTYNWNYAIHHAPDAFARELFDYALATTTIGEIVDGGLRSYDSDSGQDRLDENEEIHYFDAALVERWIQGNKSRFGLEFAKPSYTLFVLDSYTKDLFPHDETYYYWDFKEDLSRSSATMTLRVFGGNYDFLWIDFSAAPNTQGNEESPTADNDPPIWEYDGGDTAQVYASDLARQYDCTEQADATQVSVPEVGTLDPLGGCRVITRVLMDELGSDLAVGLQMHVMPSFLYHPTYKPTYFINIHLFHDAGAKVQDANALERQLDLASVLDRLHSQIPWANFDGVFRTYVLPQDDPDFYAVLEKSKAQAAGTYVPTTPVMNFIDSNPDRYLLGPEDSYQVKVIYVNFEGHYAWALPVIVGGIAAPNSEGKPWGVLGSHADALVAANIVGDYGSLTAHEVGHFWGLNHPHDGTMRDPETGDYYESADFTFDSVSSPLTYRMTPYYSDQMDRDHLARGMTAMNVNEALKTLRAAYENERAAGLVEPSAVLAKEARIAEESVNTAITLFQRGLWVDGVVASIAALEASQRAVNATGGLSLAMEVTEWDGLVGRAAWSVPVIAGDVAVAPTFDYQEFEVRPGDETVRIRVDWTNGSGGACDLFVGWHMLPRTELNGRIDGLIPLAFPAPLPVSDDVGVFDIRDQVGAVGPQFEEYVLDLDDDGVRENGKIFAGAGTKRPGVCPYHVTVEINYREARGMRGDGAMPAEAADVALAEPVEKAAEATDAVRKLLG